MCSVNYLSLYKSFEIDDCVNIKVINEPDSLITKQLVNNNQFVFHKQLKEPVDLIHLFTKSKKELSIELPTFKKYLRPKGKIVISWPQESERFSSDLDSKFVSELGIKYGLLEAGYYSFGNWSTIAFKNKTTQKL